MDLRKWANFSTDWLTGHQNPQGTSNQSSIMKFLTVVEIGTRIKGKFQKPKLSLLQPLEWSKFVSIIYLWNDSRVLKFRIMVEFGVIIKEKYEKPRLSLFQPLKWKSEDCRVNFHKFLICNDHRLLKFGNFVEFGRLIKVKINNKNFTIPNL